MPKQLPTCYFKFMDYYHPKDKAEKEKFLREAREKLVDCKTMVLEVKQKLDPLVKLDCFLTTMHKDIEDYIKFLETGNLI